MLRLVVSVFLLTLFGINSAEDVCNVTALSSVNVWGHVEHNSIAVTYENVNFHTLEQLREIDVTRANVTQLCERMIRYFPKLESLTMIGVNLSVIHKNAFQNVPKLAILSLSVNHISHIIKGAFTNLPSLKKLYLSNNQINFIEDDAFSDLPELQEIHLDRNQIASLSGNLFKGCTKIRKLDFSHNQLKKIEDNAFDDLKPQHSHLLYIKLTNNRMTSFSASALSYLPPVELHLENNEIFEINSIFFSSKPGSKLFFNNNNVQCLDDTVAEEMRNSSKFIYIKNNPLNCECVGRIDDILGDEIYGVGEIIFDIDCTPVIRFE